MVSQILFSIPELENPPFGLELTFRDPFFFSEQKMGMDPEKRRALNASLMIKLNRKKFSKI